MVQTADFLQSKNLTTLGEICFNSQAINLKKYVDSMVVVVIPCHIKHLEQGLIVDLLKKLHFVNYVREFVIVINGSLSDSNDKIRDLNLIDSRITVLLENSDFKTQLQPYLDFNTKSLRGKGYALWLGFAYVCNKYKHLAIVATIDADIKTFTHDFLLKLLYPLVHFGAHLNKGYYVRYADEKLTGRLARLLVFPLLQAMKLQLGSDNLCDFLSEFRYPISGDVAITSRLISQLSLMQGWSYDLSLLIQARKRTISEKLFQTEVTDNYQHINR